MRIPVSAYTVRYATTTALLLCALPPPPPLSRPIPGRGVHGDVCVRSAAAEAAQQCSGASAADPQPQEALRGPVCPSTASTRAPGDGALAGATPRLQVPGEWQPKYLLKHFGWIFSKSSLGWLVSLSYPTCKYASFGGRFYLSNIHQSKPIVAF